MEKQFGTFIFGVSDQQFKTIHDQIAQVEARIAAVEEED
jgi:hypothetical protein